MSQHNTAQKSEPEAEPLYVLTPKALALLANLDLPRTKPKRNPARPARANLSSH